MVGKLKRAVQKVVISNKIRYWFKHLGKILGGYPSRPVTDGNSPFEMVFGIRHRFVVGPTQVGFFGFNTDLGREFEIAVAKSARASRIGPSAPEKWTNKIEVGRKVIVRRGKKDHGSKIESINWFDPFIVKEENHPR